MKKLSFIPILSLAILIGSACYWSSCTKIASGLRFNLPLQTGSVNITIPATSNTGTVTFGPVTNNYNVDSFIKANTANQLGISNISSVKLASCTITINNPDANDNFANFSSCSASFSSNTQSSPFTMSIPSNPDQYSATLNLPVDTSTQLSSYLGDQFIYSISGTLRRPTTVSLQCTISYAFNIIVQG